MGQGHGVRDQVGLGQDDEGLGDAVPGRCRVTEQRVATAAGHGQGEEPLHPAQVELHRQRDADGDVVDVGGEHLALGTLGRGRADEGRAPRQQRTDELRVTVGVDGRPVARADDPHRVTGHDERGVRADRALRGDDVALPAVDAHHASRHQALFGVRGELGRPVVVPAVGGQGVRRRGALKSGEGGRRGRRERQGKPFTGWPRRCALRRGGSEEGQPVATGVGTMLFGLWAAPIAATVINVLTSGFTHGPAAAVFAAVPHAAHDSPRWPGGVNGFIAVLRSGVPERSPSAGISHALPRSGDTHGDRPVADG